MKKLLVVWKSVNDTDIKNFIVPYTVNSKKHKWFDEVELLIWGASQEKVMDDSATEEIVKKIIASNVAVYACKMCADNVGASELLISLGVNVMYTGVFLSDKMKDSETEVITI